MSVSIKRPWWLFHWLPKTIQDWLVNRFLKEEMEATKEKERAEQGKDFLKNRESPSFWKK